MYTLYCLSDAETDAVFSSLRIWAIYGRVTVLVILISACNMFVIGINIVSANLFVVVCLLTMVFQYNFSVPSSYAIVEGSCVITVSIPAGKYVIFKVKLSDTHGDHTAVRSRLSVSDRWAIMIFYCRAHHYTQCRYCFRCASVARNVDQVVRHMES